MKDCSLLFRFVAPSPKSWYVAKRPHWRLVVRGGVWAVEHGRWIVVKGLNRKGLPRTKRSFKIDQGHDFPNESAAREFYAPRRLPTPKKKLFYPKKTSMSKNIIQANGAAFEIVRDGYSPSSPWSLYRLGPDKAPMPAPSGVLISFPKQHWVGAYMWKWQAEQGRVIACEEWNRIQKSKT